ncbi:MAG TPA: flagellar biosynthetic protein FliQ [Caulobacteraceae bacterium]
MRADQALQLLDHLLWTTFLVAAPLLISCLVVGLLISVLQVATQLQEMTLSYVPKLAVAALVLVALGPWMIQQIMEFAIGVIKLIPSLS